MSDLVGGGATPSACQVRNQIRVVAAVTTAAKAQREGGPQLAFHQLAWWLLYVVGIIPDVSLSPQADRTARCPPGAFPSVLGRPLGNRTGPGASAARPRELLGVRDGLRLDRTTLVGWFVVPLIKGTPLIGGPPWIIQVVRPIPNIAFGLGAAVILRLLPTSFVWAGLASKNGQPQVSQSGGTLMTSGQEIWFNGSRGWRGDLRLADARSRLMPAALGCAI